MIVQVEPLLEVLVGKCLEQGLMEVMEEEELAAMRSHQQHYEQVWSYLAHCVRTCTTLCWLQCGDMSWSDLPCCVMLCTPLTMQD